MAPQNMQSNLPNNLAPSAPSQQQSASVDNGAYPAFQKFTNTVPGAKPGSDPLDELDLRLKNIKDGL